jgi:hypothetical protein
MQLPILRSGAGADDAREHPGRGGPDAGTPVGSATAANAVRRCGMISVINLRRKPWPFVFVYVGRPFAGLDGHPLANPFKLDVDTPQGRQSVLERYEAWLDAHPDRDRLLWEVWADTEAGRHPLACWCSPLPCHATLIARELESRYGPVKEEWS